MLIKVKVKTNAGVESVEKISSDLFSEEGYKGLYFVQLKASPEGGKANLDLLKILTRYFKKEVKIKSGFTSKLKVVEIVD
jgi:uncharacterized protein (TIGR00251 family)